MATWTGGAWGRSWGASWGVSWGARLSYVANTAITGGYQEQTRTSNAKIELIGFASRPKMANKPKHARGPGKPRGPKII